MASHVDLKGTPAFSDAKPAKEPYTYVCTFFQSINYQVAFFAFKWIRTYSLCFRPMQEPELHLSVTLNDTDNDLS